MVVDLGSRGDFIRRYFDKGMRLLEIGASYNPIVPKRDGWQTTIIDHASKAELIAKYADNASQIEEVDVIWTGGSLADAVPPALHGTFDGLIASHVIEHMPDIVSFLQSVDKLLKPDGIFFLAVPDKRVCFDFFQPLSTTGQALDAIGLTIHHRGVLFDHAAYYAMRGGQGGWFQSEPSYQPFSLAHPLAAVGINEPTGYQDAHKWRFTPASFRLMMLELRALDLMPWVIDTLQPMPSIEFMVWLKRGDVDRASVNARRLQLLQDIVRETQVQIDHLDATRAAAPVDSGPPRISVVIPLYNGGRFIARALHSVMSQTLKPHEIIVVNDGSTDDGPAIVKALAEQYSITLLHRENGGQSAARNYGVKHSTGNYIALLDQDDRWYPMHLAELVKPFLTPRGGPELGWVYSNIDEIDTEGNMVTHNFLDTMGAQHPKRTIFDCLREDLFILPGASLISRNAFDAIGGFDERLSGYEDDDLFMRLYRACYGHVYLETPLSQWRIYPQSSSYTPRFRRSRAIYAKKLIDMFPDDPNRHRYYIRDLIMPRFYPQMLIEYGKALKGGSAEDIAETRADLLQLVQYMPPGRRKMMGRTLARIGSRRAASFAFESRMVLRPILRRLSI